MQLIGRPMLAPGICVICERSHQVKDADWVDTGSTFDVGVVTFLTGRKVICNTCSANIAELIGYVNPLEFARMKEALSEVEAQAAEFQARAKDLETVQRAIDRLREADVQPEA